MTQVSREALADAALRGGLSSTSDPPTIRGGVPFFIFIFIFVFVDPAPPGATAGSGGAAGAWGARL
eukprot:CAMPEP_0172023340 /NCGR_PEP_ID=MMETSP1041-20130122/14742_1 /TAXON_ID=464988 /ORGANISM="Hemiselmis andersenii, Strain CCMP439" /LENGTH=65 /DNA_ID=CAMNT_0012678823 /DNA_START=1 /DNA_END=199 /DNA_ORIENTATION=-